MVSFQFPSHRDMPCDEYGPRVIAVRKIPFSSLLIGICLVTERAPTDVTAVPPAFSSLLIGICLVTSQEPGYEDIECILSVPFSSGYAL